MCKTDEKTKNCPTEAEKALEDKNEIKYNRISFLYTITANI